MRKLVMLLAAFFVFDAIGQPNLATHFKNLKPRNIGPAGMSGRVTTIDAVHSNPDVIYIGAASGGVWKTENAGASWAPMFDEQPILNIGAIAITQSNPSIVWAGTGEGNPRNSISLGEGIYKSMDAGKTWKLMGLEKTRNIHRILIDPNNPNTVYVGAIGNPYGIHPERGVYKTTDGGDTWTKILYSNDTTGVCDMVMDASNPNKLLVAMWNHRRTPYSFKSGGPGSGMFMTYDGGKTWKKLGKDEGLPDSTGRVGLAIAKSDSKVIYALVESKKNALYRTDDGGFKWEKVNEDPAYVSNRPFYFQDIAVDPQNENRVYNIYQMIAQSDDGGKSFKVIIPYNGVHPDHHAWWIHPMDPSFIINGNDGGIAFSRDRGRNWQFDEKLALGQFYHIAVDNELPYNVMGGLQDNGSWRGPAYVWQNGGIRNSYWQGIGGGDGFDASPDPDDANWVYSMSQGGALGRQNAKTGEDESIRPPSPAKNIRQRFNWNAAFAQDPFDNNTIYYGSQFVNKSTDKGKSWIQISADLSTNDTIKTNQEANGGLSIDITGAENYCTILAIEPGKIERNILWVGTDDGQVQLTRDGGSTWTNLTANIKGLPKNAWIPQIRASRYNTAEAFVIANNYRQGDFGTYVFRTTDFGKTWTRMVDETKVKGYALCILQDPVQPNLIFLGTEQGLWISFDGGAKFQQFKNGYPSVSTYDLAIQEREADLVIATFGRALYILDDIRPLRDAAAIKSKIKAFEPPVAYQAFINGPSGVEWSDFGLYAAENRPYNAALSFFVQPKQAGDTSKLKIADSTMIRIYNSTGENIRSYKVKSDTGFNRTYWNFSTRGTRNPQAPKPRPNAPEQAGGLQAPPGTYKIVYELGKEKDSTTLIVKYDPRSKFNQQAYEGKKTFTDKLNKQIARITTVNDALTDADDMVKKIDAMLKDAEGKDVDSLRKAGKAIQDSIKNIRYSIFGKPQEKQGYGTVPQLTTMSKINEARFLAIGKNAAPGQQEEKAYNIATEMVQATVNRANEFLNGAWKKYRQQSELATSKIYKEVKLID
jgi:photosystem II stability/assembly factor-like uncharacterized protein